MRDEEGILVKIFLAESWRRHLNYHLVFSVLTLLMKNEKTPLMLNLWASMENSLTCFTKDGFK